MMMSSMSNSETPFLISPTKTLWRAAKDRAHLSRLRRIVASFPPLSKKEKRNARGKNNHRRRNNSRGGNKNGVRIREKKRGKKRGGREAGEEKEREEREEKCERGGE